MLTVVSVVISPFVVAVSLFRPSIKVGKRWIMSLMILMIMSAGLAWAASAEVDRWITESLSVLGSYSRARIDVRDLPFSDIINLEASRNGLDPSLVAAMISQESGFQTDAVSWRGARGLMQIRPITWREFRPDASCSGEHPPPACGEHCIYHPRANIGVGSRYLRYLIDIYQGNVVTALAAYNAGMASVSRYEGDRDGLPPFPETQGYTRKVVQFWANLRGENAEARIAFVSRVMGARTVLSYFTVANMLLLFMWVIIRYRP